MFAKLQLSDFRGFVNLDLDGLQRVNLIVGRNNSGKTSLLEAIVIACQPRRLTNDLPGLLRAHPGNVEKHYHRWIVRDGASTDTVIRTEGSRVYLTGPGRRLVAGDHRVYGEMVHETDSFQVAVSHNFQEQACRVASVQQRDPRSLVQAFDRAMTKKGGEDRIEGMLRQVDPRLKKIRLRAPDGEQTFIEVDLGLTERLPLAQCGQGLGRLVAVFSELLGEQPKICLIDEIENGIHHSLLPELWRGIATAARELNVQIFATTHSYECIVAAHEAMAEQEAYDFSVVQLFRHGEQASQGKQGRVLDKSLIEAAVKGEVDLR